MGTWVDRLTLSQRKLLFAVVAVGLIGLGVVSLRSSGPGSAGRTTASDQTASDQGAVPTLAAPATGTDAAGPGGEQPVAVEGLNADKVQLALPDDQIAAAQAVAEQFCAQYATRRWDEPPSARLSRLTPFMSEELAAAFASSSGGAAMEQERKANQEVAIAQPEFAYPQAVSRAQVVFTVVVLQRVTTLQETKEQRPSFQVVLEPRDGQWRVVNVVA